MTDLRDRVDAVRDRMERALAAAGRPPHSVRLIAVTKTQAPAVVEAAIEAGLCEFGENRVEEAMPKMAALPFQSGLQWHMIGHIQSRKAKAVAQADFALVHSVDSLRLGERLSAAAVEVGRRLRVLLECNVSGEASKAGFPAVSPLEVDALGSAAERLVSLPGLEVRGLMTIAPIVATAEAARPFFARLRGLAAMLSARIPAAQWNELSMGMTDDFEAAIAEGATLIRVGRAIFGERN